jgi:hypothetical protein
MTARWDTIGPIVCFLTKQASALSGASPVDFENRERFSETSKQGAQSCPKMKTMLLGRTTDLFG